MKYNIVRNKPVAKFFYKGSHSHPVRRTVLVIESDQKVICGYEVREGNTVREPDQSPVKSFARDRIATTNKLRPDSKLRSKQPKSTLNRLSMRDIQQTGV